MPAPKFSTSELDANGNRALCRDGHPVLWPGGMFVSINRYHSYGFCAGGKTWRQEQRGYGLNKTLRLVEVEADTAWHEIGGDFALTISISHHDTVKVGIGQLGISFKLGCRGYHPHTDVETPRSSEAAKALLQTLTEQGWSFGTYEFKKNIGTGTALAISCPACLSETAALKANLARLEPAGLPLPS